MPKNSKTRGRKSSKIVNPKQVSLEKKRQLAQSVEQNPELWKLAQPGHWNKDARDACWKRVAATVQLTEQLCRKTWKTLVDSLRYHLNKSKSKSGAGLSENDGSDDEEREGDTVLEGWELWDAMKFYLEGKPQRLTISSMGDVKSSARNDDTSKESTSDITDTTEQSLSAEVEKETSNVLGESEEPRIGHSVPGTSKQKQNLGSGSNVYDYVSKIPRSRGEPERERSETEKLVSTINELVAVKKSTLESRVQNKATASSGLKYHSMYMNLDRVMSKLPESIAEDLNIQFMNLAHCELKKLEDVHTYVVTNRDSNVFVLPDI